MATDSGEGSSESSNKRLKIQNPETSSPTPLPSSSESKFQLGFSKGKSKVDSTNVCGICLSEAAEDDNRVSRGCIDSCDHYFCFVCIMEWAKVETKCPLCKRRFATIRRPPKPPVFPTERIAHIPVRNQVYGEFGNVTTGPLDLYLDCKCSVCQSSAEENLLLLCDLCDTAAHTFCVGLGAIVPEGDWFCQDCTLLRAEQSEKEMDMEASDQVSSGNFSRSSKGHVSIFDILREPGGYVGRSSASRLRVDPNMNEKIILPDNRSQMDARRQAGVLKDATNLNARTLRRCRNVHDRIQILRNNWNSLRSGSLSFCGSKINHGSRKHEAGDHSSGTFSTSCSSGMKAENGSPDAICNRHSSDISKAWKMMDIAKSKVRNGERKSTVHHASKKPSISNLLSSNTQGLQSINLASIRQEKQYHYRSCGKDSRKHKTQMPERESPSVHQFQNGGIGFPILPGRSKLFFKDIQTPAQYDLRGGNDRKAAEKIVRMVPSTVSNDCTNSVCLSSSVGPAHHDINDRKAAEKIDVMVPSTVSNDCSNSVCLSSSVGPASAISNSFHAKVELCDSSSCKIELPNSEVATANKINPVNFKAKGNSDAKSEIQSLVKLNLKLLTKDRRLEVNEFKEVARLATHSIIAACGLKRPKPGIDSPPSFFCCHASDGLPVRRSTLMPNSCRECFYEFVKNVVLTTISDKIRL